MAEAEHPEGDAGGPRADRGGEAGLSDHSLYPTEDDLRRVREWPVEDGWPELLAFVKSLWWAPSVTWREANRRSREWPKVGRLTRKYRVSTGGWSGNEDLIEAMQSNWMFWAMCWESHRRGGHYEFRAER